MVNRPVAVPALAKLVIKDTNSGSRLWLARQKSMPFVWPGKTPRHKHES
jgi:hypothetical protein